MHPPCEYCQIPANATFFDSFRIVSEPEPGESVVLASQEVHRTEVGVLLYFAQFTTLQARDPAEVSTPGLVWQLRRGDTQAGPIAPYLPFEYIVNPWGAGGIPLCLRLPPDSVVEFVVSNGRRAVPEPETDSGGIGDTDDVDGVNVGNGGDVDDVGEPPKTQVGGRLIGYVWPDPKYVGPAKGW